jgi:hypothetical protein
MGMLVQQRLMSGKHLLLNRVWRVGCLPIIPLPMAAHDVHSGQRGLQTIVHPIGPSRRRNHHDQLNDLLLREVYRERLQIARLNVARITHEQIREPEQGLFLRTKDTRMSPTWLLQCRDLFVGEPVPLARSGMAARSIRAAIHD